MTIEQDQRSSLACVNDRRIGEPGRWCGHLPKLPKAVPLCGYYLVLLVLAGCEPAVDLPSREPEPEPVAWASSVSDQAYRVGTAIVALTLPAATGGRAPLSYALEPVVPGLSFDAGTRTLSGTPTVAGDYRMSYAATDASGTTATLSFVLAVATAPEPITWSGTVGDQSYEEGAAITALTLPAASGGQSPLSYSLEPTVPGLSFDGATRRLSGTPNTEGRYRMTYRVTDADGGSASITFTITVRPDGQPVDIPEPAPPSAYVRGLFGLEPYYRQWIDVGGLPVLASGDVDPYAVKDAAWIIAKMVGGRSDLLRVMVGNRARFSIIGHTELITNIPEYQQFSVKGG